MTRKTVVPDTDMKARIHDELLLKHADNQRRTLDTTQAAVRFGRSSSGVDDCEDAQRNREQRAIAPIPGQCDQQSGSCRRG